MSVLFLGGRRDALFPAPVEPFEVFGVVEDRSFDAEGEGVSATEQLSADMSSRITESLMMAGSDSFFWFEFL